MMLEWKHTEKSNSTIIELPVRIKNSVNRSSGLGGHYICNNCEGNVEQTYICSSCGTAHLSNNGQLKNTEFANGFKNIVGKMDKRKDKLTGIVYNNADKNAFLETTVDEHIKVIDEIKKDDVLDNIEFVDTSYEIFNNDDMKYQDLIKKIHNFLYQKNIVLLVQFGYRGNDMGGFIISTKDKLILFSLRDSKLIKDSNQLGLSIRKSSITEELKNITESHEDILYKEFLNSVAENKPIVKKKVIEEKPREITVDFLKGF